MFFFRQKAALLSLISSFSTLWLFDAILLSLGAHNDSASSWNWQQELKSSILKSNKETSVNSIQPRLEQTSCCCF